MPNTLQFKLLTYEVMIIDRMLHGLVFGSLVFPFSPHRQPCKYYSISSNIIKRIFHMDMI